MRFRAKANPLHRHATHLNASRIKHHESRVRLGYSGPETLTGNAGGRRSLKVSAAPWICPESMPIGRTCRVEPGSNSNVLSDVMNVSDAG